MITEVSCYYQVMKYFVKNPTSQTMSLLKDTKKWIFTHLGCVQRLICKA